jgi:hypothetical protein
MWYGTIDGKIRHARIVWPVDEGPNGVLVHTICDEVERLRHVIRVGGAMLRAEVVMLGGPLRVDACGCHELAAIDRPCSECANEDRR